MFQKGVCPICNNTTTIANKSGLKYNNENICFNCSKLLSKQKVNIFNIQNFSLNDLRNKINIEKIENGEILICPICHSHNIELLSNDKNYKTKKRATVNLNPFKPFTIVNIKEVKKETDKKHNEFLCKECGNRWIGK